MFLGLSKLQNFIDKTEDFLLARVIVCYKADLGFMSHPAFGAHEKFKFTL